jgi:purine-nucleoside phosphorylase
MGTVHNRARKGEIAKTVLMPGDPLRAKFIAENYLTDVHQFNDVRCMYGFTGRYREKEISVMGSGMGMPSMGIYSYELYTEYDVDNIIRIGSAGALSDELKLMDIVAALGTSTDSNYAAQYRLPGMYAPTADFGLLLAVVNKAKEQGIQLKAGNIVTSDVFYNDSDEVNESWKKMGVLAVDMESAALYMNAARCGKHALSILTISDHLFRKEALSADSRQTAFDKMMKLALEAAFEYE